MTTARPELSGVPGVPETLLSEAVLATMPSSSAPAPWAVRCAGLIWTDRGGATARQALPPALRESRALASVGGLIRYAETPVGVYDEAFGLVVARAGRQTWGNVAFMAVDSPASLVGGRANWSMPKTLAQFEGAPESGGMSATSSHGPSWRVSARPRTFGPAWRMRSTSTARQQFPDGRVGVAQLSFRGRARLAVVEVEVASDGTLGTWLRSGRRLGMVIESAVFSLGEPRFGD